MKGLFVFLLLLSIIFFAFMQWGVTLTGVAKNGPSLGELNPEKIKSLDMPASTQMPGSAVLPVLKAIAVTAPVAASAPAQTAVAAASVVTAPLPALAPAPPSISSISVPVSAPAVKATTGKICMEWGEFSGTDLARAAKALAVLKLDDRLTQRTVEYASGYWVYIPPLRNQSAVNKKIAEIKAAGVADYFVVKESRKWHNAISLGVFKTEEAAKKFRILMKKKGLHTAKMGERKSKLKFTVFMLKFIDAEGKNHLLTLQKDFAGSELKTVACQN